MTSTLTRTVSRPAPAGLRAAQAAAVVGGAYAAVSIAWGLGSTVLLDTVGGELAAGGREGRPLIVLVLWIAVAAKLAAVVLPLLAVSGATPARWSGIIRVLTLVEAVVLTGYGLVLTVVGLLVQADVIHAGVGADHRALAWHAYLWDPWFLLWGPLVFAALLARSADRHRTGRLSLSNGE
jgi:hypothetical protein